MSIRRFTLYNGNGDEMNLQDPKNFAYNPSDLGISISTDRAVEQGYFRPLSATSNMVSPKFNMIFGGDTQTNAYGKFFEFTQFLSFPPLRLRYRTDVFDYIADVDLGSLTKGEISPDGVLYSEMVLNRISPFYIEKEVLIGQREWPVGTGKIYWSNDEGNDKFYGNQYSYTYGANLDIPTLPYQDFIIPPAYSDPSVSGFGTIIRVESLVDDYNNPHIIMKSSDDSIVQNDKYILTLNKGESIEISSYPRNMYAVKLDKDGKVVKNIINNQDWTYNGFIKVFKGFNRIELDRITTEAKLTLKYREEAVIV